MKPSSLLPLLASLACAFGTAAFCATVPASAATAHTARLTGARPAPFLLGAGVTLTGMILPGSLLILSARKSY